jgi:hypothetical protein
MLLASIIWVRLWPAYHRRRSARLLSYYFATVLARWDYEILHDAGIALLDFAFDLNRTVYLRVVTAMAMD